MIRQLACLTFLLCGTVFGATFDEQSIVDLEARKQSIELELKHLARSSLRGGVGTIGYRSKAFETADSPYWVEIDLEGTYPVSEVVLVPVLWRDMEKGFQADAFPEAFRIMAGTDDDREGKVIAEYQREDGDRLGITPLVVPVSETSASWIRVEVERLSKRIYDDSYVFQLSELFVFSEGKNVALRKPTKGAYPKPRDPSGAWSERFLVDGATPYLMNSSRGESSHGFIGGFGQEPILMIDLGAEFRLSEVYLHVLEQSDTVPQAYGGDLGIPRHFKVEGSLTPEFENSIPLVNYYPNSGPGGGPILMWNIPESLCRYVRVVPIEKSELFRSPERLSRIGFAEIELIEDGVNVAQGKLASTDIEIRGGRQPAALTDGANLYGEILPIQMWLRELAKRHELNVELSRLLAEIDSRHAQ